MDIFAGVLPLVTVADTGSFRAAARALGVTPSAVSKAIARLESELGVRLIHRTSRVMRLTPEGEDVVAGFREALERVRTTRDTALDVQRVPRGRLRVTWPLSLAGFFADRVVPRMVAQCPRVEVTALITDRVVDLAAENVDLAIRIGELGDSSLIARKLGSIRWITVASPAYLAERGVPQRPQDLTGHACLRFVLPSGRIKDWEFRDDDRIITIAPTGAFTADHGDALVGAALADVGIVQAQDLMLGDHLASGALVELLNEYEAPGPSIHALSAPTRKLLPKIRAFIDLVADAIAERAATSRFPGMPNRLGQRETTH
jgi:LysR family transcriptional regulator, regulator for bpeEF and oprC